MTRNEVLKQVHKKEATIAVLGLGHIGLPIALGFAELGWRVIGADSDPGKVAILNNGECHFYEPGLQELLTKHLGNDKFSMVPEVDEAVRRASILFMCVGTPQRESGGAALTQ